MNRCLIHHVSHLYRLLVPGLALVAWLAVLAPAPAAAQALQRNFPPAALRGMLQVTQSPEVLLNGTPDRLSPGARLKDTFNRLVMSASLSGQTYLVNYVRNPLGQIHEVWLLTPQEAEEKRSGMEPNYRFASELDQPKQ
jgi:hypothetical protein